LTRHLPLIGRPLGRGWHETHPLTWITTGFRPCSDGALVMAPLPAGTAAGQPFLGMDPSAPSTYVRPWNPQPGMIAFLNFDGAAAQGNTPMGGTWRGPQRDRPLTRRRLR